MKKKKVVFLWSGMSGYMAACWKAFALRDEYEAHFLVAWSSIDWGADLTEDLPNFVRLRGEIMTKSGKLSKFVEDIDPDRIVICGWHLKAFREVAKYSSKNRRRLILAMDTPWKGSIRQYLGKFLLKSFLSKFDTVVVAGERTFQYARYLGFADGNIKRGVYAADLNAFAKCYSKRKMHDWPRSFLFVGRLTHGKGIPELLEAYSNYRSKVDQPWNLIVCGAGELEHEIKTVGGVDYRGFIQPDQLPECFMECGAFVLPSRYEPWGVVVAEACGAGLPVICTESVNSAIDLVRPYYNGITVGTQNVEQLQDAMHWVHEASIEQLSEFGRRSMQLVEPYSAQMWAVKWSNYIRS